MGSVPVADLLASEARRDPPTVQVRPRQERRRRPYLQPFPGRSIERVMRACQQLPQNSRYLCLFSNCVLYVFGFPAVFVGPFWV